MASKSKRKSKKPTLNELALRVGRNLEKGEFKQALKDARVCHQAAATDENRRLLECAYIGRAQELMR